VVIQLTPIDRSDHLVSLLENLVLTLEERQQRAVERAALARTLNAYIGQARALEAADVYGECCRLIEAVLDE
jgi:hypothetical protein